MIPSDIVSKFDTSREYVRWARDAIKELQATLSVFVEQSGGGIVIEKDPKTGIVVEKLRFSESIPGGLRRREATLMRWKGDAEVTGHYDFEFEVVLDDPCLPMPVNAIGGLTDFAAMASHVIETLQAACLSLASRT